MSIKVCINGVLKCYPFLSIEEAEIFIKNNSYSDSFVKIVKLNLDNIDVKIDCFILCLNEKDSKHLRYVDKDGEFKYLNNDFYHLIT